MSGFPDIGLKCQSVELSGRLVIGRRLPVVIGGGFLAIGSRDLKVQGFTVLVSCQLSSVG